jgi:hypothetical protein
MEIKQHIHIFKPMTGVDSGTGRSVINAIEIRSALTVACKRNYSSWVQLDRLSGHCGCVNADISMQSSNDTVIGNDSLIMIHPVSDRGGNH